MSNVKSNVVVGFEFTCDAFQWCHQIYNLFAYSFDLDESEVKYVAIMTSPLTYVKDGVKYKNYTFSTLLICVKVDTKYMP